MKRLIRSASEYEDYDDMLYSMAVPNKYHSETVQFAGLGKDILEFSIYNWGNGAYSSQLRIKGNPGVWDRGRFSDFEDAKDAFYELIHLYSQWKNRFKGVEFTEAEVHKMMYT